MTRPALKLALAAACSLVAFSVSAAEYELVIEEKTVNITGVPAKAITVNGTVPGPTLRFREGDTAYVRVTNKLKETTSVHWHGLVLDGDEDGVPGFNGFEGIKPGQTYTYEIPLRQNGTYWYHAHSATQEQRGHYGAIIIDPASAPVVQADREYVVVFSDFTTENPDRILNNLKVDPGYYNYSRRTVPDFFADARKFGLGKALKDRFAWGRMRMDPTDIADVGSPTYTFLVNGKPPKSNETFLFRPGERVKLRFVNAAAMTYFDVRVPGLKMTVVAADGRNVEPVSVDEFRLAVAETYDVIVEPESEQAFTVFAESIDRSGYARATLAPQEGMSAPIPQVRPRALLTMGEMGHNMSQMGGDTPGMDHSAMGATRPAQGRSSPESAQSAPSGVDHAAMGHGAASSVGTTSARSGAAETARAAPGAIDHAAMGHGAPAPAGPTSAPSGLDHAAMGHVAAAPAVVSPQQSTAGTAQPAGMDHSAMGHGASPPAVGGGSAIRAGTAVPDRPGEDPTPLPKVDYGMGQPMAMDSMTHAGMAMPGMSSDGGMDEMALGREGEFDGAGRVFGWSSGAPWGAKVLSYADLRSFAPQPDTRPAEREIVVRLTGNMERYIWTLNDKKFGEAEPIRLRYGERVRLTFVNETMMAHPMHLHGMFMQLENGQPLDRVPDKHVVSVAPGKTYSVLISVDAPGEWAFHCHLLYHMESGMMQKVVVARYDGPTPAAPASPAQTPHAGHGGAR
jgi:CopA family copper-resistance protein